MPIDPSMLAKSIGTLTDLHPDQDLPATLGVGLGPTRTGIVPVARPIGPRPGSPTPKR
jgi:hypothetical protein